MILYVDYNDVCRAPLAAAIHARIYGEHAYSAGVYADEGAAICDAVRPKLLDGHRAHQLSASMLEKADVIWCVTTAIAHHLIAEHPEYANKIYAMEDVADPFGMGAQAYEQCAAHIRRQMEERR